MSELSKVRRAVVVAVQNPEVAEVDARRSLSELRSLLSGLGVAVSAVVVQKRAARSSPTYLGEGKLREVAALTGGTGRVERGPAAGHGRDMAPAAASGLVVVADDELSPGQLRNLEAALGVEVLDRTAVILHVFEARAQTREARLEVELARLAYELPRVRDDHGLGDREGGGGRAARGHTNVELRKQRTRARMAAVRRELARLAAVADQGQRGRSETWRVALVGYTNAGKSSLMRRLTGRDVLVQNRLFATVDTTVGTLTPPAKRPILIADTVGFIDRCPHLLVAPFRSTLAEARGARLLLHVADAADPAFRSQMAVVQALLTDLGVADTPALLLLNKADQLTAEARVALAAEFPAARLTNALDRDDVRALRAWIVAFFENPMTPTASEIKQERRTT